MKNKIIMALLLCFIICSHLVRDYHYNIKKSIAKVIHNSIQYNKLGTIAGACTSLIQNKLLK